MWRFVKCGLASYLAVLVLDMSVGLAVNRSWDGGGSNDNWSLTSNWSPNGNPGGDDLTIGDMTPGAFTQTIVNTDFTIDSLSVINGAAVDTDGNRLVVSGLASFADANTTLRLRETSSGFSGLLTENLFIGSGAEAELYENAELAIGNGMITNFGRIDGSGGIRLLDNPVTPTNLFTNTGTLAVGPVGFTLPVPERTLEITSVSNSARVDLDGNGSGTVLVGTNATLDLDVQMLEPFSGTMTLAGGSTLDVEDAWQLDGDLNVNNSGFNTVGDNVIAGGLLGLDIGGIITLDEADEVLRFTAPLLAGGGSVVNHGTIVFDAPATIGPSVDFQMNGTHASLVVNSQVTFDNAVALDGAGTEDNVITVNETGHLIVGTSSERTLDNVFNINGGHVTYDGIFTAEFDREINMHAETGQTAQLDLFSTAGVGPLFTIGDDSGTADALFNVSGPGVSQVNSNNTQSFFVESDGVVNVDAGATLEINGSMATSSGALLQGAGTLRMGSIFSSNSTGSQVYDVDHVDLDYHISTTGEAHSFGAPVTINADSIEEDGGGFDGDIDISHDPDGLFSPMGRLTMNVPGGWRFNSGTITLEKISGTTATMLSGDRVTIGAAATLAVDGQDIIVDSPFTLEGELSILNPVHNISSTGPSGGPRLENRIEGGIISGSGLFDLTRSNLVGFGTIDARILAGNGSRIVADDGTLAIRSILQLDELAVSEDGILDLTLGLDVSDVVTGLELQGGEVTGGRIINEIFEEIFGNGLVSAQLLNSGTLRAVGGGTLTFDSNNGVNSYLGIFGNGELIAQSANLVLRNPPAISLSFRGLARAESGQEIFVDGFRIDHDTNASLELNEGAYRVNAGVSLAGTTQVTGSTPSRFISEGSPSISFLPTSNAQLDANLEFEDATVLVETGATFNGLGRLVTLESSSLHIQDGGTVGVSIINQGSFDPGTTPAGPASVTVGGFTQTATGELEINISGVNPGTHDLISVAGLILLDGTLEVGLFNSFEPILGNNITILETTFGLVDGTFSSFDFPVFNGLTFDVIYNPQSVVLEVVELTDFDLDDDGDIDGNDFLLIQRTDPSLIPGWQTAYPNAPLAASRNVPEPYTLSLIGMAIAGILSCRRREYVLHRPSV